MLSPIRWNTPAPRARFFNACRWLPLASACFVLACSRDPEKVRDAAFQRGETYFKQQKYAEAVIEYQNAIKANAAFGPAHLKLADAYMAMDDTRSAFPEYIRAADLLPDNDEAQVKAGRLLVNGGFFAEAKDRARKVLQRNPKNIDALMVLGNSLAGVQSVDDATGVLSQALQVDPERAGIYANLAVFQLAKGDTTSAETTFTKALELQPNSIDATVNLANFYRATARRPEAEKLLLQAHEREPKNERVNSALGSLYVEWNRPGAAEQYFKTVVANSKNPTTRFALSNFYLRVGRFADAIKVLEDLAVEDPSQYGAAKTQIALLQFAAGRSDEAQALIDEVLKREPRNSSALVTKSRLQLTQQRLDDALDTIKLALALAPSSPEAQLTLGRIELAKHNIENARKAFNETLRLDPRSLSAMLELSELHRNMQQIDTAVQFAEQAIRTFPNMVARLTLVRALMVRPDDHVRADKELQALATAYPRSPRVQGVLATFALNRNDLAAAARAFQRELELDPTSIEGLSGLVAIDLSKKDVRAARARIDGVLAKTPDDPGLLLLSAKVYRTTGETEKMKTVLNRALELDPSSSEAYGMLGYIYMSEGKVAEAKARYAETARLRPHSVGAPTMVGMLSYAEGNKAEAQKWWEDALKVDPNAVTAANNLAVLYTENGGDLESALQLARRAQTRFPDQPEFNDTVGWIYYKKHASKEAIWYLEQSAQKDQNNPIFRFHLGMAYAQKGEDAIARRHLTAALALDKNFPGADEAKKTISTLVY